MTRVRRPLPPPKLSLPTSSNPPDPQTRGGHNKWAPRQRTKARASGNHLPGADLSLYPSLYQKTKF